MLRRVVVVAALAASVVFAPTAKADAPAQVVSSTGGLIASGGVWSQHMVLADGSSLEFTVALVVPQGEVTATPASGGLALARPWVHVNVWKRDNVNHTVAQACNTVSNPERWSAGALNPQHPFTDHYGGEATTHHAPAWEGVWVDVQCDDGAGYDFYRVSWELNRYSWLTTNPVAVLWAVSPASTWSASSAQGTVTFQPTAYSTHPLQVCGHRAGRSVDCFSGGGRVVPLAEDLVSTARPFAAQVPFVP